MARFTPDFLDQLRDRLPVSTIVGRKVKLTRKGAELWGLCPFHGEKSPSFKVNDERGRYHCFGCGKGGDIVRFLTDAEGMSFPEAVESLAREAGLPLPVQDEQSQQREQKRKSHLEIMELACRFFEAALHAPSHRQAQDYVAQRGLRPETIKLYRVGYAPAGNQLKQALMAQGVSEQELIDLCLIKKPDDGRDAYDFFRDRLMFAISNRQGQVIAFGGRVIGEGKPKYLNSSDTPLFNKSETLFGMSQARQAIHANATALICEGYMDVIALAQAGFRYAVAPLGTALTEKQMGQLWRLVPEPVLCLDGDAAGLEAAQRSAIRSLPHIKPGQSLKFLRLPEGQDPDDYIKARGSSAFSDLIKEAKPLIHQLWRYTLSEAPNDTPERQTAFWQRLEKICEQIEDADVSAAYAQHLRTWYEKAFKVTPSEDFKPKKQYQERTQKSAYQKPRKSVFNQGPKSGRWGPPDLGPPLTRGAGQLRQARLQALLLTFSNHPALIQDYAEALSEVEISNATCAKWRDSLLDAALSEDLSESHLDVTQWQCHLKGLLGEKAALLEQNSSGLALTPFASREASIAAARDGLDELLAFLQDDQARADLKAAQIDRLRERVLGQSS